MELIKNTIVISAISLATISSSLANNLSSQISNELGETAKHILSYSEPVPKLRIHPKYPVNAARNSREGWSKLSFIVETNGSVSNILVTDSSGSDDFNKESIKALKKWKYEPAIENGKPIQQCVNSVQLNFKMQKDGERGVRRRFKSFYNKANEALKANNLPEVEKYINKLSKLENRHLSESNFYHLLAADFHEKQNNKIQQISHLSNIALEIGFSQEQKLGILLKLFNAQLSKNLFANALSTYKKIAKLPVAEQYLPSFNKTITSINGIIESKNKIIVNANMKEKDFWHHKLVRNSFTLANINGSLHKLDVRCANKRHVYSVEANNTWTIPDSWQHCSIFVYGDDNTSFNLVELHKPA